MSKLICLKPKPLSVLLVCRIIFVAILGPQACIITTDLLMLQLVRRIYNDVVLPLKILVHSTSVYIC